MKTLLALVVVTACGLYLMSGPLSALGGSLKRVETSLKR